MFSDPKTDVRRHFGAATEDTSPVHRAYATGKCLVMAVHRPNAPVGAPKVCSDKELLTRMLWRSVRACAPHIYLASLVLIYVWIGTSSVVYESACMCNTYTGASLAEMDQVGRIYMQLFCLLPEATAFLVF
jgi:hypothetical protein